MGVKPTDDLKTIGDRLIVDLLRANTILMSAEMDVSRFKEVAGSTGSVDK